MAKVKSPTIEVRGKTYLRAPIKTHHIQDEDNIVDVVTKYATEHLQEGDIIFVSEKVVAVTQGRALKADEIKIGFLANTLWKFVTNNPGGVGLRSPISMQCAINEAGALRILLAAAVAAITKPLGRKGDFYRIAGMQAATIDAAGTSPLQMDRVILGPKDPDKVAAAIHEATGHAAAIVDVNDIGGSWVLGSCHVDDPSLIEEILLDNPLGQKDEQTPVGLIREQ